MKYRPQINVEFLKRPLNRAMFQIKAKQVGLPPGSLVHVGQQKTERPEISLILYDQVHMEQHAGFSLDQFAAARQDGAVTWLNLSGIHDTSLMEAFGQRYAIHPLALEDILNTHHRPKLEDYDGYSLVILKMLLFDEDTQTIKAEQVSLVLGKDYVLSFQELDGDVFDGVRDRLRRSNGRIRQRGADYLAYALMDSVVDGYFHILEKMGDCLVRLEEELLTDQQSAHLATIHHYRRELLLLRKSVWPLRELINQMHKEPSPLISEGTLIYLRDLYDHSVQVIETLETFRDTLTGLQDLYMSSVSNRMNEIMKVLTIMASIFIPLTFIAGIYGMNFEYMPELQWHWGYFAAWGVMLGCVAAMLGYFRYKRWL